MAAVNLLAERRDARGSRPAGRVRREDLVPAVVYGLGDESVSVGVPARELSHILAGESGTNTLLTLKLDGTNQLALIRQIQRHPVKGTLTHVDFVRVRADVAIQAEVPVRLVGEAEGVARGGVLEQLVHSVSVEAMPGNIPNQLEIDITELEIGESVHIGRLEIPAGVTLLNEPDEMVAQISAPRVAEEGAAEGAEGVEGAEGAPAAASEGGDSSSSE
jgi:large subunit ribosomal protein L25